MRPDPRPASLRGLLAHTARDLDSAPPQFYPSKAFKVGPDYVPGYGLVQVTPALQVIDAGGIEEDEVEHHGFRLYAVSVAPGRSALTLTLAWDDPAAADGVAKALINDLDLVVLSPSSVQHFPWTLNPAQPALPAVRTQADRINNLEQVRVEDPEPGIRTFAVSGHDVGMGPQSFSVISDEAR